MFPRIFTIKIIIPCILLTSKIGTNEAQKPILRAGLGNENGQETLTNADIFSDERNDGYTQGDSRYYEEKDDYNLQSLLDQKAIILLGAVDHESKNKNKVEYNKYDKRGNYKQRYNDYEERIDNRFEDKYDRRIEDEDAIETQNKDVMELLSFLLHVEMLPEETSLSSHSSNLSELFTNSVSDKPIKDSLRKGPIIHKITRNCVIEAQKTCKKACKKAYKTACGCCNCTNKLKKMFARQCQQNCRQI